LIDFGADLNCIQEGLIPCKYFEKSAENLNSDSGSKLQIKYELNNVHVCHNNVCFHIPYVLVKNMTDKVILGIPFVFILYPFTTEEDGVSTVTMGIPVKFHFASRFEIDVNQLNPNLISAKTKFLNFLKQEVKYKRIAEQLSDKLLQSRFLLLITRLLTLFVMNFPMLFGIERSILFLYLMSKIFLKKRFLSKSDPFK
jgi:hypothetical protein